MFRRIVAIFVVVGFIAGQWLAIPHSHGAATRILGHSHSSSPHIHLSWFFGDCHAHEHAHHGHGHGKCGPEHRESSPLSPAVADGTDHDSDALYISIGNSSVGSPTRGGHSSVTTAKSLLVLTPVLVTSSKVLGLESGRLHPPEVRAPNCALYLTLRTLRI